MRIAVSRAPGAERVVTPLELFFDLVYVFAIAQLSHHLLEHVDLRTGAETVVMTLAVVYAWYMTAWGGRPRTSRQGNAAAGSVQGVVSEVFDERLRRLLRRTQNAGAGSQGLPPAQGAATPWSD
jgi:hypothetical protein